MNGRDTFFMPFNKGDGNGGAGNSIGMGTMTDYLWKEFLSKETLRSLITQFVYVQRKRDTTSKKTKETLAAMEDAKRISRDPDIQGYSSINELFKALDEE